MAAASASSGAVFFLGTRAHYQVLQQPSQQCDIDNGNSTSGTCKYNEDEDKLEIGTGMKRRSRRASEMTLCERDDMQPALLNARDEATPKKPRRRGTVLSYLQSLGRRKQGDHDHGDRMLQSFDGALLNCSYRESCRCLECQSSYFDCDESDDYNNSEDSDRDYDMDYDYPPRYVSQELPVEEYDDEVFEAAPAGDNTSDELLIDGRSAGQPVETKMSISSDEVDGDELRLEVAAGTPVVLNYLLTHPITCCVQ